MGGIVGFVKKEKQNNPFANRMSYLIGHLKANLKMLEQGRYCIDIIQQNQAVIAALKKVNELILKEHLDTCVTAAIRGKSGKERRKVLEELVLVFQQGEKQ